MPISTEPPSRMDSTINHQKIPGVSADEAPKVRYVSFNANEQPASVFRAVTRRITPPLMKGGGVVLEGCVITIPKGIKFYSLYFHGDISGWQKQIEHGAQELGLLTAAIDGDSFVVSDGNRFDLADCQIELD